jgi:hypothetical protein
MKFTSNHFDGINIFIYIFYNLKYNLEPFTKILLHLKYMENEHKSYK